MTRVFGELGFGEMGHNQVVTSPSWSKHAPAQQSASQLGRSSPTSSHFQQRQWPSSTLSPSCASMVACWLLCRRSVEAGASACDDGTRPWRCGWCGQLPPCTRGPSVPGGDCEAPQLMTQALHFLYPSQAHIRLLELRCHHNTVYGTVFMKQPLQVQSTTASAAVLGIFIWVGQSKGEPNFG